MPLKFVGWPAAINAYEWNVAKTTHKLDGSGGYLTSLELENKVAAGAQAAIDHDNSEAQEATGVHLSADVA